MNYEARVADLSGAPDVLVEEVEIETGQSRRKRLVIAAVIVLALLVGGALLYFGGSEESAFPPQEGRQVPTVSVIAPGRTTVAGTINATIST